MTKEEERCTLFNPDIRDPYVYLKSLLERKGPDHFYRLFGRAKQIISNVPHITSEAGTAESSLNFLLNAASAQRAAEIRFIRAKIAKLSPYDGVKAVEMQNFLSQVESGGSFDYRSFIKLLNEVLIGINETTNRIKSFLDTENSNKKLLDFSLTQASTLINSLGKKRDMKKYSENYDEAIRFFTMKFMEEHGQEFIKNFIINNFNFDIAAINFSACAIYLQQSLIKFLVNNPKLFTYLNNTKIDNFEQYLKDTYANISKEFKKTREAQIFIEGGEQLQNIINEISNFFKLKIGKVNRTKKTTSSIDESLNKLISTEGISKRKKEQLLSNLRKIQITANFNNSKTSLGNFKELDSLISGIFVTAIETGHLNTGTDSYYVGDLLLEETTNSTFSGVQDEEIKILNDLKKSLQAGKTNENTEVIKEAMLKLEKLYQITKEIESGFIVHESTKFYKTIEKGRWHKHKGFSGRSIVINNYIDHIASMGLDFGINTDWLKFAALNLSDNTVGGSSLTNTLSNYFLVFAGLIMFDDFEILAQTLLNQLTFSNLDSIHFYKLQDLYFPSSYFLQETYNLLSRNLEDIKSNNSFQIEITVPSAEADSKSKFPENWEKTKNSVASNTLVKISFALNFLDFMSHWN